MFIPPSTIRGGGIKFTGYPSVVRPLTPILRDAVSLYLVEEFK